MLNREMLQTGLKRNNWNRSRRLESMQGRVSTGRIISQTIPALIDQLGSEKSCYNNKR